jgi:PAS domain S-box-containing protein
MNTLTKSSKAYPIPTLENLLGSSPFGVFVSDPEGEIWYANRFLNKIFGEEISQKLRGSNLFDLEWVKDFGLLDKFMDLKENNKFFQKELIRFKNFKGQDLHLSLKAFFFKDEGVNGFICFLEDVSEKVQLERNLKDKTRELAIINEVSLALSSTLNRDQVLEMILRGVTCGQGLGFNRAFLLLLDKGNNHLEGKMAIGTSDPQLAAKIWEELSKRKLTFKEVLQSSGELTGQKDMEVKRIVENLKISMEDDENILVKAVKNRRPINSGQNLEHPSNSSLIRLLGTEKFAVAPLVSKDKAIGLIIADNFITANPIKDEDIELLQIFASQASTAIENSELYNKLTWQVKKLGEANNALAQNTKRMIMVEKFSMIGQITSRIAHQLRNPMTIIGGFSKALLKKIDLDDSQSNTLKIIAGQIERMENILNRLLDFTPKPRMELKKTDLNFTIEQSLGMIEEKINQSGITLIKDLDKDIPSFETDTEQLQVALVNILRNSIQAMPEGGELSVVSRVDGEQAKVEIKDKGAGIAEKDLKHIFDPFYTTREDADGLGLTIASEIVRNHQGQIWAESQKANGTSIFINLPMKRGGDQ